MIDIQMSPASSKAAVSKQEILDYLHQYQQEFFTPNATSVKLPDFDYETVILIGIGGSAMGSRFFYHFFRSTISKSLIVLDNIHPDWVEQKLKGVDLGRTICVSVSKSGNTLETLVLTDLLLQKYQQSHIDVSKHFYAVSDNAESELCGLSQKHQFDLLQMPQKVGGRFSLFTESAMVPLALLGLNTTEIMSLAQEAFQTFLNEKFHIVQTLSEFLYSNHITGRNNLVIFNYEPRLSWFGPWVAQLICESLGKQNLGFQVVPARGTTDQHSMTQHWKQGADNTIMVFIEPAQFQSQAPVSYKGQTLELGHLTQAFLQANQQVFEDLNRPSCKFTIECSSKDLIDLSCLWMLTTAYLGVKFNINAFDQPAVDFSKRILNKNLNL